MFILLVYQSIVVKHMYLFHILYSIVCKDKPVIGNNCYVSGSCNCATGSDYYAIYDYMYILYVA